MVDNYLSGLVNKFFKILPMKETGEPSLNEYMSSLKIELSGCKDIVAKLDDDAMWLTLISILQYMTENECDVKVVKREVFKAISLCKKMRATYAEKEGA